MKTRNVTSDFDRMIKYFKKVKSDDESILDLGKVELGESIRICIPARAKSKRYDIVETYVRARNRDVDEAILMIGGRTFTLVMTFPCLVVEK